MSYKTRYPGRIIVDLAAIKYNAFRAQQVSGSKLMGIVKANGYGHGLVEAGLAYISAGALYLGTAQPYEAVKLRKSGIDPDLVHILTWMITLDTDLKELAELKIDYSVGNYEILDKTVELSQALGRPIDVHVKVDHGFGRDGFRPEDLENATQKLAEAVSKKYIRIRGLWTHFAMAGPTEEPDNKFLVNFILNFRDRLTKLGVDSGLLHVANSLTLIFSPEYSFDMVRPGFYCYGLAIDDNTVKPEELGSTPAMRFEAELANI
jgi:alanine racemase